MILIIVIITIMLCFAFMPTSMIVGAYTLPGNAQRAMSVRTLVALAQQEWIERRVGILVA